MQEEYRVLRDVLFDIVEESGCTPSLHEMRVLGDAITAAIGEAVNEFAEERARALAEARKLADERDAQFRTLADAIPQLAWIAEADGSVSWFNGRWYEYTGTTFDEAKGWGWINIQDPAEVDAVVARFRDSIAANVAWEDTFALRSKSGEYRRFLSRALPIRDAEGSVVRWFGTNTDVEDRMRAEEQFTRFFAIVPDILCVADFEGRFLRVNPAFEKALGWTEEALIARPYLDFVHPDDRARTREEMGSVTRGVPTIRFENRY